MRRIYTYLEEDFGKDSLPVLGQRVFSQNEDLRSQTGTQIVLKGFRRL